MHVRSIPKELGDLIHDWFPTIDYKGYYIAGGFIRSFYLKKQPKDMDIFFYDLDAIYHVVNKLIMCGYHKEKESRYAITMKNGDMNIQLIKNIHGPVEEVFKDFDFTVCQIAVNNHNLCYEDSFFDDLDNKRLVLNEESFNRCATTLERVVRYASYGFMPDRKQLNLLIKTIKNTDENDLRIGYRKEKKAI